DLMNPGAMDVRALVRLSCQIAEALAFAHESGVVHGDVKPENVVVQPEGSIKLLDFGIARRVKLAPAALDETVTSLDWLAAYKTAGTVAYMAPEKLLGEGGDFRSDLFSFGVVLFEMATGKLPFPGPG